MRFGYIRVSTREQNTDRQEEALAAFSCDEIITDKVSGKNDQRAGLSELRAKLRKGDEVYVKSVDRLARNTKDLLTILDEWTSKGVSVRFVDNGMTFSDDATSKLVITILGAVAEMERNFMRQRQSEGIRIAKEKGTYKRGESQKTIKAREKIKELKDKGLTDDQIYPLLGVSRATFYRLKKEVMRDAESH